MKTTQTKTSFPLWAKLLLGFVIFCGIFYLLFGLGIRETTSDEVLQTKVQTVKEQTSDLSSSLPTMNTEQAIKTYLDQANTAIQEDKIVKTGDTIVVDYIGRLSESEVFDTSVESVAQAAGLFNPQRNYTEGLSFTVGSGNVVAGFDEGVLGMKVGETKTVTLPPEKAYGEKREDMIFRVPLEQAGDTSGAVAGMKVMLGGMYPATIAEINEKEIVFDANHDLAGKTLIFDITIKSITPQA